MWCLMFVAAVCAHSIAVLRTCTSVSAWFGIHLGTGLEKEDRPASCEAIDVDALEGDLLTGNPFERAACVSRITRS